MQVLNHRGTKAQRGCVLQHQPFYAVSEDIRVEVEQKALSNPAQSHVAEQLCGVHRKQSVNRFQFNDQISIDQKIQPKRRSKATAFVNERQVNLPLKGDVSESEFVRQTGFVDRFQQTRPHRAMDFYRATDNRTGQAVTVFVPDIVIHASGYARFRGSFSDKMPKPLCLCASVVSSSACMAKSRA